MSSATVKAIRPSNSASAKPRKSRPCCPSAAAGLRSALFKNCPNTKPTPMAATPVPIAARPAPMSFAEATSIIELLWKISWLVKIDSVAKVQRRQQRKNIGLKRANQQLERAHADDEQETDD